MAALHVFLELLQFADDLVESILELRVRSSFTANSSAGGGSSRCACTLTNISKTPTEAWPESARAGDVARSEPGAVAARGRWKFSMTRLRSLHGRQLAFKSFQLSVQSIELSFEIDRRQTVLF